MKRSILLIVLVLMLAIPFVVNAQQPTRTPAPTNTPFIQATDDGRSVQFSVQPADDGSVVVPIVPQSDNTAIYIVVVSVAAMVFMGILVRPAIISAGRNLPPEVVDMFLAPVNAALELAAKSASDTASVLDDAAVAALREEATKLAAEIKNRGSI